MRFFLRNRSAIAVEAALFMMFMTVLVFAGLDLAARIQTKEVAVAAAREAARAAAAGVPPGQARQIAADRVEQSRITGLTFFNPGKDVRVLPNTPRKGLVTAEVTITMTGNTRIPFFGGLSFPEKITGTAVFVQERTRQPVYRLPPEG